jgi:hypothetical protein
MEKRDLVLLAGDRRLGLVGLVAAAAGVHALNSCDVVSDVLRSFGSWRRTTALLELGSGSDVVLGVLGNLGGLGLRIRFGSVRVGFRGLLTSPELPWTMGWPSMGPFWLSPPLRGIVIELGGLGWVLKGCCEGCVIEL